MHSTDEADQKLRELDLNTSNNVNEKLSPQSTQLNNSKYKKARKCSKHGS